MKNFSKILILVLSLALILGSIMIITSAETVEGWNVERDIDFTGVESSNVASNNDYATSGQLKFKIINFDSSLEHSIQTNPADDNTYWQVKAYGKSSKSEYFSPGYGGGWFNNGSSVWTHKDGVHTPGKNTAQEFPYFIYQIDVMSPTGYFPNSTIANCYRFPKSGTVGNGTGNAISLLNDAYGSYVKFNGAKLYVDPYEFTTITVIAQAKFDETKAYSYLNVYVNGKFFGTKLDYTFTGFEGFNPSTPNFSWEDCRLQFVSQGDGVVYNSTLAIDNMMFVLAGSDYVRKAELEALITNRADLKDNDYATAWTENVYADDQPAGVAPSTKDPSLTMTTDFNSLADAWGGTYGVSGGSGNFPVIYGGFAGPSSLVLQRAGSLSLFTSEYDAGNKAIIFTPTAGQASSGGDDPYFQIYPAPIPNKDITSADVRGNMFNDSYYVVDLDVLAPSGKFVSTAEIQMAIQAADANGSNATATYGGNMFFGFGNDDGGNYVYVKGADRGKHYIPEIANNWAHLTYVMKMIPDKAKGSIAIEQYLYCDGVQVIKVTGFTVYRDVDSNTAGYQYYNDVQLISLRQVKIAYRGSNNTTESIAYDNFMLRMYDDIYDGNLGTVLADKTKNLSTWEGNIYDESEMPYGLPVVEVDGTKYDGAAKASAAMAAMGDNAAATMIADLDVAFSSQGKVYYTSESQLAHIKAASGYSVSGSLSDANGTYVLIVKNPTVHYDYHWGAGCCGDEANHPLSQSSEVGLGEALTSKFVPGDYADAYILVDGKIVKHTGGWKFLTKNGDSWTVGAEVGDATVDMDMVNAKDVYLVPVYTEADVAGKSYAVVDPDTRIATLIDSTKTLKEAFAASANTDIIMLLSDVSYDPNASGSSIGAYGRTLDINGFTLDVRNDVPIFTETLKEDGTSYDPKKYDNNKNKISCFNNASGFTVTSSKVGGKIFNACTYISSSLRCTAPFISSTGDVTFKAASHDHLAYYGGTIVQNWSGYMKNFVVDGGSYFATQGDNTGFFHLTTVQNAVIKNALVVTKHGGTIYVCGHGQAANTSNVLVDNCIFIADGGSIIQHSYDKATILFTNCYLDGNINANSSYTGIPKGQITIGAGNYIGGELGTGVVFADGVVKYDVNSYFKISYKYNEYKSNPNFGTSDSENKSNRLESDLELFDKTSYSEYTAYTGAADLADVTVHLRDEGDYVGDAYIKSGMIPSGAYVVEIVVNGWVNREATWYASYSDKPVTETVTIDYAPVYELVEAFADTIYYVYEFKDHLGFFAYLPVAPEGIEYASAYYDTDTTLERYTGLVATTIGGRQYNRIQGCWPGVAKFATGVKTTIKFTYDGQTFTYTTPAFKLADYLEIIIDNEENQYTEAEVNFAYGLARYVDELLTIRGKADAKIKAYADASPLEVLPEGFGEKAYEGTDISEYVSIHLNVYDSRIRFAATVTDTKYTVKFVSGSTTLKMSPTTLVKNTTTTYESGEYKFYDIYNKTFDIVVYEGEAEVARAEGYDLSYYAAAMAAYDAENGTNYYGAVCAIYEFGAVQVALRESRK